MADFHVRQSEDAIYTVYKITGPTGKVYIGCTKTTPKRRWRNGKGYKSGQPYFYADIETGEISNRRVLFTVDESIGVPDGLCIDSDDNIWLAIWGGNRIECHSGVDGELLAIVDVDATQTSSCCFLGDSNKLFITTAGVGVSGEYEGCLFTCEVDATGVFCDKCHKFTN